MNSVGTILRTRPPCDGRMQTGTMGRQTADIRPGGSLGVGPSASGLGRFPWNSIEPGFTLFEILVVLAILSIVATISVPSVVQAAKKSPMRQAISDLEEACRNARMLAILEGEPTEVVIRAGEGALTVSRAFIARPSTAEPGGMEIGRAHV